MLRKLFVYMAALLPLAFAIGSQGVAGDENGYRISGPLAHGNLAIYFVHGASRAGPVPLTLQEALAKGVLHLRETGSVNELQIENVSSQEVFVQSGDIVKGGQQDRVLIVSLVLPPHSGLIPIASYCVEQNRWSGRGREDVKTFSQASAAMPSREAKIAMKAPMRGQGGRPDYGDIGLRQQQVWKEVSRIQERLGTSLGTDVASPQSRSSLQLALENRVLEQQKMEYVKELQAAGEKDADVIGYVFAINGKLNSADIYPSNGLFRKMWPKLIRASATEAISDKAAAADAPPTTEAVTAFLEAGAHGKASDTPVGNAGRLETRESAKVLYFEAKPSAPSVGGWMHRNYLAK